MIISFYNINKLQLCNTHFSTDHVMTKSKEFERYATFAIEKNIVRIYRKYSDRQI